MRIGKIRKGQEKDGAKKPVQKKVAELLPVTGFDAEDHCYQMKEGLMDLMQVSSKDLVTSSADEVEYDCLKFCKAYRLYEGDLKLIVMNFPCNTKEQQEYLQRRMSRTSNMVFKQYLQRQIDELEWLEKNNTTREFYFMFWASDQEELEENRRALQASLHTGRDGLLAEIPDKKKHQILYRLNNKCSQAI